MLLTTNMQANPFTQEVKPCPTDRLPKYQLDSEEIHSFEPRLIEALQPLRFYMLAINVYHLFETGLFDTLESAYYLSCQEIATRHGFEELRVKSFLQYLRNEGIVIERDGSFGLSSEGRGLAEFRPWYTMFVGGYAETFLQIGPKLKAGSGWASRNLEQVGNGSCGISHYDAIPVTRRLMAQAPTACTHLLDMGCGNGRYLVEFCQALPEIEAARGVEPSLESCIEAEKMVAEYGLQEKVKISHGTAGSFLNSATDFNPNFVVLGFVLHEILGQEGEAGVCQFLLQMVERFPNINIIIIEVDNQVDNPSKMRHELAQAYYNPYYLLHPFTQQRLETQAFWERIFSECALEIVAKEYTNPQVDSTQLEVGYLLRKA